MMTLSGSDGFIRPLYDLEDLITYADDNYAGVGNDSLEQAKGMVEIMMNRTVKWMKMSGLKIKVSKTELCVFHRRNLVQITLEIDGILISSKRTINVLGITFDSKMKWNDHVEKAIKESSSSPYAIKLIGKYFSPDEVRNLLTALFYSKLYYGSEVWHLPGLELKLKKGLKLASANACKLCIPRDNVHLLAHTEIHNIAKRALPDDMCMYKHAVMLHKLLRNDLCDDEMMNLNFQLADNERSMKIRFIRRQNYDVGKNILLNRLHVINDKIDKNWINLSIDSYKMKCKELFLMNN